MKPAQVSRHPLVGKAGFSLVEVTLSLGIVAFALVATMGLLPVGLSNFRASSERTRALENITTLSACIEGAEEINDFHRALAPFRDEFSWQAGDQPRTATLFIDENGLPVSSRLQARQVASVYVVPPANPLAAGRAYIVVAWPGQAEAAWQGDTLKLTKSQGYVESTIYFQAP